MNDMRTIPEKRFERYSAAFVLCYVLLSGLLMMLNTVALGLGDPKFGSEGWRLYWPLWAAFYSPALLVALLSCVYMGLERFVAFYIVALAVILTTMELSFIFDISAVAALIELVVLSLAIVGIAAVLRTRASPGDNGGTQ
jgi:hypothetical protein